MRKTALLFSEKANLQIAAVIPSKKNKNSPTRTAKSSSTSSATLRARVPIQTIEIPVPCEPEDTGAAASSAAFSVASPAMVNIAEASVSSHSSSAANNNSGGRDQQRERSGSSRRRRRSHSPFKLFRRPFHLKGNSQRLRNSTNTSGNMEGHQASGLVTSMRDDGEHQRATRSGRGAEQQQAAAGQYDKEKLLLHQHLHQDFTEVTESNTTTSTLSEREARRQQLFVTESHPHALTSSNRRSETTSTTLSKAAAAVSSASGQRKQTGTAAFMRGGTSSSDKSRSRRSKDDDIAIAASSSLDTDEDLVGAEAAAADAAADGRAKSKSSSRKHSRKTKKVPRVKESRIVWTKGMQQDYQRHEAAKAAAAAAAEANDSTDKSLSTLTLTAATSSSKYQQQFKLYLLLLNPTSKIFELIQLIYAPATTTVGDILKLIPPNATEPALASQQYTGLARPKRSSPHFMNLSMLASNSPANCTHEEGVNDDGGRPTCGIGHGEILLAIPFGFTPQHVIRLAKQILANPRIQALLHAANPLHKHSHGHHHQSRHGHRNKSSTSRHGHSSEPSPAGFSTVVDESTPDMTCAPSGGGGLVRRNTMESVHEEYASQPSTPVRTSSFAENLKAAATAGVPIVAVTPSPMKNQALLGYQKTTHDQTTPVHSNAGYSAASPRPAPPAAALHDNIYAVAQLQQQRMSLDSFIRVNNQAAAVMPMPALGGTYEEASVDMSYSSWSQSVDSSFSSLVSTSMRSSSSLRSAASFRSASASLRASNSSISINSNGVGLRSSLSSTTTAYLTNSRRQRHVKFVKHVKGMALVTFGFMVAFYFVDPAGYAASHGGGGASSSAAAEALQLKKDKPLGFCGTFQALIVMFFLVKFQLFLQATPHEDGDDAAGEYQHKCPFLATTTVAMERFRKQLRRHRRRQQQRSQKRY